MPIAENIFVGSPIKSVTNLVATPPSSISSSTEFLKFKALKLPNEVPSLVDIPIPASFLFNAGEASSSSCFKSSIVT